MLAGKEVDLRTDWSGGWCGRDALSAGLEASAYGRVADLGSGDSRVGDHVLVSVVPRSGGIFLCRELVQRSVSGH